MKEKGLNVRIEDCLGHSIRFVEMRPSEWWAVAQDVANVLKYQQSRYMLHLIDDDEKDTACLGECKYAIISEFGIYEAIFRSTREEAKEFKKWVKQARKGL